MYIEYMLLATDSSIDQEKTFMSVFSILEDLEMKSHLSQINFPVQIIISVRRENELGEIEDHLNLHIQSPDGHSLSQELKFKMLPEHKRFRFRVNTILQITTSGQYRFSIFMSDEKKPQREMMLNINFKKN